MAAAHSGNLYPSQRLFNWIRAEKRDLWAMVAYSIAIGLFTLAVPVATQAMVNTIAFGSVLQPVVLLGLVVLIALGFSSVLRSLRSWVVEVIQRRVFVRVTSDAVHRLLGVKIEAYDPGHGPELVNRFFEVVTIQKSGSLLLVDGLTILMQTLVGLILLAVYHPLLLAFGVVILVSIVVILFPLGSGAVPTAILESKAKYSIAAWLEELARFPATFKSAAGTALAVRRADQLTTEYLRYRAQHFRVLFRQIIGSFALESLSSAVLLAAGGYLVIQRQLTLGQLVAAELILAVVVGSFSKFGKQLETYYDLLAAVDKLGYLTDLPMEASGPEAIPGGGPALFEMRDAHFAHATGATILDGTNLRVEPGERVAITAPGGTGKSSLLDLIYGVRQPASGRLRIDGLDYRDIRLDSFRQQVQLVRGAEVFQGTVRDNVSMGDPGLAPQDVRDALASAGLLEEILRLPDGLETPLTTGGLPLSHSQCLRLVLARAIVHRPRLLLIDEALDYLIETAGGEALCQRVFAPGNRWTAIVATRHPVVASLCDRQLQLESGKIVEVAR